MPDTHITPAMGAAVGAVLSRQESYPVSESDIRRWALAVYWPDQPPAHFVDEKAAQETIHGGIVAPEEFNPFAWAVAAAMTNHPGPDEPNDPDLTEVLAGVPGPGLKFQLNGGMETEYGVRMRPGDVITSVRRLRPYTEREGRLGLMLLSSTEDTWTNQDGNLVKRTVTTLIRY